MNSNLSGDLLLQVALLLFTTPYQLVVVNVLAPLVRPVQTAPSHLLPRQLLFVLSMFKLWLVVTRSLTRLWSTLKVANISCTAVYMCHSLCVHAVPSEPEITIVPHYNIADELTSLTINITAEVRENVHEFMMYYLSIFT